MRRPYKALSLNQCVMQLGSHELIDRSFLHDLIVLGLRHKSCPLSKIDWMPLKGVRHVFLISFGALAISLKVEFPGEWLSYS